MMRDLFQMKTKRSKTDRSLLLESNRKHEILQTKALITVSALQGR